MSSKHRLTRSFRTISAILYLVSASVGSSLASFSKAALSFGILPKSLALRVSHVTICLECQFLFQMFVSEGRTLVSPMANEPELDWWTMAGPIGCLSPGLPCLLPN